MLVNLAEYESRASDIAEGSTLDYYDGGSNDEIPFARTSRLSVASLFILGSSAASASETHTQTHTRILGLLADVHARSSRPSCFDWNAPP
jgi:hypothetical protein